MWKRNLSTSDQLSTLNWTVDGVLWPTYFDNAPRVGPTSCRRAGDTPGEHGCHFRHASSRFPVCTSREHGPSWRPLNMGTRPGTRRSWGFWRPPPTPKVVNSKLHIYCLLFSLSSCEHLKVSLCEFINVLQDDETWQSSKVYTHR